MRQEELFSPYERGCFGKYSFKSGKKDHWKNLPYIDDATLMQKIKEKA